MSFTPSSSRRGSRGGLSTGGRSSVASNVSNKSVNIDYSPHEHHNRRVSTDTATLLSLVEDISVTHDQLRYLFAFYTNCACIVD